jgi:hypothetical protein
LEKAGTPSILKTVAENDWMQPYFSRTQGRPDREVISRMRRDQVAALQSVANTKALAVARGKIAEAFERAYAALAGSGSRGYLVPEEPRRLFRSLRGWAVITDGSDSMPEVWLLANGKVWRDQRTFTVAEYVKQVLDPRADHFGPSRDRVRHSDPSAFNSWADRIVDDHVTRLAELLVRMSLQP